MITANIGFFGSGGIATALATGLCSSESFGGRVFVFDIHDEKTGALKKAFPDKVTVTSSNQEVADASDVIFPTLRPQSLEKAAPAINFKKASHIIHIAAGIKLSKASSWYEPAANVVRAVPLPFAAKRTGPVVLFGEDKLAYDLLALLGSVVKVNTEKDLEVLAAVTGVMVSYYGLVDEIVKWCMTKGMDYKSANDYATYMNEALSAFMREKCKEGEAQSFMRANATPGGMNELAWNIMKERGAYKPWSDALSAIGKYYDL